MILNGEEDIFGASFGIDSTYDALMQGYYIDFEEYDQGLQYINSEGEKLVYPQIRENDDDIIPNKGSALEHQSGVVYLDDIKKLIRNEKQFFLLNSMTFISDENRTHTIKVKDYDYLFIEENNRYIIFGSISNLRKLYLNWDLEEVKAEDIIIDEGLLEDGSRVVLYANERFAYLDADGNQLLQGDHIQYLAKSEIFLVMNQYRIKAYDRQGNEITEISENEWMYEIAEEYIGIWREGQTFVVNRAGEVIKGPYEEKVIFE